MSDPITSQDQSTLCNPSACGMAENSSAEQLNNACFCKTLNRDELDNILKSDALNLDVLHSHPQLFSNTSVFISPTQLLQMQNLVHAIERVVQLPGYQQQVLAQADETAKLDTGTAGVFMGYDFHLGVTGPQLIEINTNAGGGFLNAALLRAQTDCCRAAQVFLPEVKRHIDEQFVAMFISEWRSKNSSTPLTRIAIVDENPRQQFLYPEFKMAQRLFERNGIEAVITDPQELYFEQGRLVYRQSPNDQGAVIDLIYNRLTDFALSGEHSTELRAAYLASAVVVTPNPRHHALYANKRNLAIFSDEVALKNIGANDADITYLRAAIPYTQIVSADNAEQLWQERKHLFFKPATGYGSKAAYRGDKITKRVWDEILQGDYVAQQQVPPSERGILVDEQEIALKMDIRAYVYAGEIQLLAARLYQGQTTNFRTQGGGFAPVFLR
ncbi:MAG: hypothetical protein U5M23_10545 [Marinagarivorans sp.]|nr:hypothetical protein [Marinagarivorans sp.]